VPQINETELKESKLRIYFNNHARAKAVRNAFLLTDMLLIEHQAKGDQDAGPVHPWRVQAPIRSNRRITGVVLL